MVVKEDCLDTCDGQTARMHAATSRKKGVMPRHLVLDGGRPRGTLYPRADLTMMTIVTISKGVSRWARIRGQSQRPRPNSVR
jgi:hypothetical protein